MIQESVILVEFHLIDKYLTRLEVFDITYSFCKKASVEYSNSNLFTQYVRINTKNILFDTKLVYLNDYHT